MRDGRIASLTVLDGAGALLRSLSSATIVIDGFRSQTIKVARRELRRTQRVPSKSVFCSLSDSLLVADLGLLTIDSTGGNVLSPGRECPSIQPWK